LDEVTLTLTLIGEGQIEIEPGGVVCTSSCVQRLPAGTAFTLVAYARPGSVRGGWLGACLGVHRDSCELTLASDTSVAVGFVLEEVHSVAPVADADDLYDSAPADANDAHP